MGLKLILLLSWASANLCEGKMVAFKLCTKISHGTHAWSGTVVCGKAV